MHLQSFGNPSQDADEKRGFRRRLAHVLETDGPAMTTGLPLISELSSGCFQVKSAPQFSRSGLPRPRCTEVQALAVRNRVKGVLHCCCVTGNSRWRFAVGSSRPNVTLRGYTTHCFCRGLQSCAGRFQEEIVRSSCDFVDVGNPESS
jgi:hypothetical protein